MERSAIRQKVFQEMPPEWRFRPEVDGVLLRQYPEAVRAVARSVAEAYFEVAGAHPATARALPPESRPQFIEVVAGLIMGAVEEAILREDYWDQMVYYGALSVQIGFTQPMIIGGWGFVAARTLEALAAWGLPPEALPGLGGALIRYTQTLAALAAESFRLAYQQAIQKELGVAPELLERMAGLAIQELVEALRP